MRALLENPRLARYRAGLVSATALVVVFAITEVMPSATSGSRGTPFAVLFLALVYGLLNGLTAAGIVLVYRTTRVLNFAQTAIGAGGGVLCFDLLQLSSLPLWIAFPIAMLVAAFLGAMFDIIFGRRFFNAPRLVLTVLTIVAAGFLSSTAQTAVDLLPIFPPRELRSLEQLQGTTSLRPLLPFPGFQFQFPDLPVPYGFAEVFAIVMAIAALVAIGAFLRYTRAGVAVRAMAENTERAALLGISVGFLSTVVWTIAGLLSGLSVTLAGLLGTPAAASGIAPSILLPALAAAVVARMRSIPVAVVAAVGISFITRAVQFNQADLSPLVSVGLLLMVCVALLLQSRRQGRSEGGAASSWAATEEMRPIPRQMLRLTPIRVTRWLLVALFAALVMLYPFVTSTGQTFLGAVIALNAIVGLSLVVLTGWSGQVSLGQFGYVAIGAFTAAVLSDHFGLGFIIAVPLAAAITAVVAGLTGLPALRIPGLFLGVATFAFALAVRDVLFNPRFLGGLVPTSGLHRPQFFTIDFEDERAMYFLCVGALVLAIVLVVNLRKSRFGRVVIAVRENDANAESAGIPVVRTKLAAFAAAGLLAGFSGALFAFQQRGLAADSFNATASIDIFVMVVVGGVGSVWGALLGSLYVNGAQFALAATPELAPILGSASALYLLYVQPGGLIAIFARMRDAALRIIAQRNQLVVPSLFADMDPEALHLRLIPMVAPMEGSGLQAIRGRYRIGTSMLALVRRREPELSTQNVAASLIAHRDEEAATV
jgi:branched-chain amino acid transport system permease protein